MSNHNILMARQRYLENELKKLSLLSGADLVRAEFEMNGWDPDSAVNQPIVPTLNTLIQMKAMLNKKHCPFCKTNKESKLVYMSHNLRDITGKILCPVLRNYICPICFATGDHAHTLKYCPYNNL